MNRCSVETCLCGHNVRTRWSLFNHDSRAATIWQKQFTSTFSYIECCLGDICWGSREWNESALHHRCWVTSSTFLFCVVIFKYTLTESHYFPQAGFSHVLTRPLFSFFSHFCFKFINSIINIEFQFRRQGGHLDKNNVVCCKVFVYVKHEGFSKRDRHKTRKINSNSRD